MYLAGIPFPQIDPELFSIGPLSIKWYGLAYVAGFLLGLTYVNRLITDKRLWRNEKTMLAPVSLKNVDDLLLWCVVGVIVGGRLGFLLFYGLVYQADYYLSNPMRMIATWEGGMSFHGGFLGVVVAVIIYARRKNIDMFRIGDVIAGAAPIGLFFGRIANFINAELWGRETEMPWGVLFPGHETPRHPSQLYEAFLEGLVLFIIIRWLAYRYDAFKRPGLLTGVFFAGYGAARFFVEFLRDSEHRFLGEDHWFTMGMALSLPMLIVGGAFIYRAYKQPPVR